MASTSGAQLLPQDAINIFRTELLPKTYLLTPNIPEAILLLKDAGQEAFEPTCINDLGNMAKALHELGASLVLIKGGHLPLTGERIVASSDADKHLVVDVLYNGIQVWVFESEYIKSSNTHGTGCSLACLSAPPDGRANASLTLSSRNCCQSCHLPPELER